MAAPSTKAEFKDYCLRQLGAPVLEINLDDDQIKRIILKTKGTNDMASNIIKGRFQPMAISSNYRKGGTGYWKEEFSNENIDLFNKLAGDALRKLNYE